VKDRRCQLVDNSAISEKVPNSFRMTIAFLFMDAHMPACESGASALAFGNVVVLGTLR